MKTLFRFKRLGPIHDNKNAAFQQQFSFKVKRFKAVSGFGVLDAFSNAIYLTYEKMKCVSSFLDLFYFASTGVVKSTQ